MPGDDNVDHDVSQPTYDRRAFQAALRRADRLSSNATLLGYHMADTVPMYDRPATRTRPAKIAGRWSWPIATMIAETRLSDKAVRRALKELRAAGFVGWRIRYEGGHRVPSEYQLYVPSNGLTDRKQSGLTDRKPNGLTDRKSTGLTDRANLTHLEKPPPSGRNSGMSSTQRQAALAAQASEHRRQARANGADPTDDC